jgi:hypothetical protein
MAARYVCTTISRRIIPGVTDMPFMLWVIYPYSIWMGCCSVLLGEHEREH